jgi:hypothetical protein
MIKFVAGIVTGIMICTVGFSGIFRMMDNGVSKVQQVSKQAAE